MGAEQVKVHSANIETLARSGTIDGVDSMIAQLRSSYLEFVKQFETLYRHFMLTLVG